MIDLRPTAESLSELIVAVDDGDLLRPTPGSEYRVGDLLDHVRGLTVAFGGAAVKSTGPSASIGPAGDASNLAGDWRSALPAALRGLAEAWRDPEAWRGTTRVGGAELPGDVAGTVAAGELSVHGWDLARACSMPFEPGPEVVEPLFALVSQMFASPNEADRGPAFGPAVAVPNDASLFDRVLGLLGRDPVWSGDS